MSIIDGSTLSPEETGAAIAQWAHAATSGRAPVFRAGWFRYENPLYLAEESAALDLLSDQRVALGISRGSPEPALRGWEAFGYEDPSEPKAATMAREKFDLFLRAIRGEHVSPADPQ